MLVPQIKVGEPMGCAGSQSQEILKRERWQMFFKLHYKNFLYPSGWIPYSNKGC